MIWVGVYSKQWHGVGIYNTFGFKSKGDNFLYQFYFLNIHLNYVNEMVKSIKIKQNC